MREGRERVRTQRTTTTIFGALLSTNV